MNKVKGFSYDTEKHKHIIDYIDKQQNGSKYIWSLVEKDMNRENIEDIVKREIEKHLEGVEIYNKKEVSNIDTSSINDILAM